MSESKTHFYNNPSPRFIHITGLTEVGNSAFENNEYLQKAHFESAIILFGENAFKGSGLEEIYIPSTVNVFGEACFMNCINLESIIIPKGVVYLASKCFYGCKNLINVLISDGVSVIGEQCFGECTRLMKISLPESVVMLGDSCFISCSSLKNINLSEKIHTIGKNSFMGTVLNEIHIPSSLDTVPLNFLNNNQVLNYINYKPKEKGVINEYAFTDCKNLRYVDIKNVKVLGDYSFTNTGIFNIIFDTNLKEIGGYCFSECRNLWIIIFTNSKPPIVKENAFKTEHTINILVPKGTVNVYKNALEGSGGKFKFMEM